MSDTPKPEPTKPITFDPRAGLMGGVTLTTENAHELAEPLCETCDGSGLRCPEELESGCGYFDPAGVGGGGPDTCAFCGASRAVHTYCPVCILKVREQFDNAN